MEKTNQKYMDFLATVAPENQEFVNTMHDFFMDNNCTVEIKTAKNGYMISYKYKPTKKAVMNYVFRKKGMLVRIYASNISKYDSFLDTVSDDMKKDIKKAGPCKRLLDPTACSPNCTMGYVFNMDGENYQSCRYGAFFFLVDEESKPFIRGFIENEIGELEKP